MDWLPDEEEPPLEPDGIDEDEREEPEPELPDGMLELLPLDPDEPPEEPEDEEEEDEDEEGDGELVEGMLEEDCWLTQPPTRNAETALTTAV